MTSPPGVFVHPKGLCESDQVGEGTRVWAFAHVMQGAVVGRDCNICDHAFVEGGVRIGDRVTVKNAVLLFDGVTVEDDVFLGPNVVFTNDLRPRAHIRKGPDELLPTVVKRGATLGAGVTVVCGITIGKHAFVAAGAVVTHDVPAHGLVGGNPAHLLGHVCTCGSRSVGPHEPNRRADSTDFACRVDAGAHHDHSIQAADAVGTEVEATSLRPPAQLMPGGRPEVAAEVRRPCAG